uniref:Pro-resilin-like n=1 Tax=Diabrotica virgifera virgifera TaxID=50390 RepID=A0A6P7GI06_DIAVI
MWAILNARLQEWKVKNAFFLVAIVSITRCEPPSTNYGTPLGSPITNYAGAGVNYAGAGSHYNGQADYSNNNIHNGGDDHHGHDHGGEPKSYEYGYQVKDEYTGTNYNKQETSDGNQVRGEYRVALPDGRTQIVTYWADWQSGFHADVKYEGEAQYPEQYNKGGYNGVSGQYGAPSGQYGAPSFNKDSLSILKSNVQKAILQSRARKTSGPDYNTVELIEILNDNLYLFYQNSSTRN